ncbi:unnamed protein product [Adineta steineri]|uniref:Uncharacterized protein n=1 Tax=Adineta steineri TaxID=433720 RepID=A0A815STF1_9BILA|nr:unnamed protein product [Adineta steineri]CAF1497197.1 unnamed protein product [Adineta steineri]
MALSSYAGNEIASFFKPNVRNTAIQIYNRIPGTLIKYLNERKIVKNIVFKDDISAFGQMGTQNYKDLNNFRKNLRDSIKACFERNNVTEIQPEKISESITKHYLKQSATWAKPGQKLSTIVQFTDDYEEPGVSHWTKVKAYVYIHITEECEHNWIATNKYKFGYDLTIKLDGISIDTTKAQ